MIALDTNVIVRLLTHDDPAQLASIGRFFDTHPEETFLVPDLVLAEVVWTLRTTFRWERLQIAAALRRLAAKPDVVFSDQDHLNAALKAMEAGGDIADALIIARAQADGCSAVVSFDIDLARRQPDFVIKPK
jgi:predicted nucleic-acid-binding protein